MADQSNIEWTDSTFNPWEGCTKVGPGCDHCYAENRNARFGGGTSTNWGPGAPRRRTSEANWNKPIKWNRDPFGECPECGLRCTGVNTVEGDENHSNQLCPDCSRQGAPVYMRDARRRVFCASLADWLDNEAPIEWLVDLLDLIRQTPNLDWLLLTKRIGNWGTRLAAAAGFCTRTNERPELTRWIFEWGNGKAPENVWLGATVVNQEEADRDIPKLLQVPAAVRFLSVEPMLGPITIESFLWHYGTERTGGVVPRINKHPNCCIGWVICGGESGPGARPMNPDWVRSLRDQCAEASVAFLVKQMGGSRDKRGRMEDLPADLRVREYPR